MSWRVFLVFVLLSSLQAQDNPHRKLNFDCETCHGTSGWHEIHFDHQKTSFALTGQHQRLDCQACHTIADFSEVAANCNACHNDVHQNKLYPDCQRCHTTNNWIMLDALKAHENTSFQLLGRHAALDCWACHQSQDEGEWRKQSSNCIACHQTDYRTASNPVHSELGFGQRCEECHSLFSWIPASFKKHDSAYFPIYGGEHAGKWESCTTCHYVPGNYSVFSCFFNCHEHSQSRMDSEHREVSGYLYDSNACYQCHRNGKGDD